MRGKIYVFTRFCAEKHVGYNTWEKLGGYGELEILPEITLIKGRGTTMRMWEGMVVGEQK
jgi:hypothetical protein